MPTYSYMCQDCEIEFEINATIAEKEKGLKVKCPYCGSNRVIQTFGSFFMFNKGGGKNFGGGCCGPNPTSGCCG